MTKNRKDFEFNHELIRKAYLGILGRYKRKPTLSELAKKTRLSLKTIDRHLSEMKFDPKATSLKLLTDDVLVSIFQTARKGNVAAQRLWLSVVEGWTEKTMREFVDQTDDPYFLRSMTDDQIDEELMKYYSGLIQSKQEDIISNKNEDK